MTLRRTSRTTDSYPRRRCRSMHSASWRYLFSGRDGAQRLHAGLRLRAGAASALADSHHLVEHGELNAERLEPRDLQHQEVTTRANGAENVTRRSVHRWQRGGRSVRNGARGDRRCDRHGRGGGLGSRQRGRRHARVGHLTLWVRTLREHPANANIERRMALPAARLADERAQWTTPARASSVWPKRPRSASARSRREFACHVDRVPKSVRSHA